MVPYDNVGPGDGDEFEWEQALRLSDTFAARYFQLLRRFAELPDSHELIVQQLGGESQPPEANALTDLPDCDLDCANCPQRWQCDLAIDAEGFESYLDDDSNDPLQGQEGEGFRSSDQEMPDFGNEPDDEATGTEPGDLFYYENTQAFMLLKRATLGWCNIYAALLPGEHRLKGLTVLYHQGRALSNLAYSIGDGLYTQPGASIAFAKRTLGHVNAAIGCIGELKTMTTKLQKLLDTVRSELLRAREMILAHLQETRQMT